jgi:hypothetical protein
MDELTRQMAKETRVTVESLTDELDAIARGAVAAEQYGAAKGAIEVKAKLHGHLIERKEVGLPGEFAALNAEQIIAQLRKDHGDRAAELLIALLEAGEPKAIKSWPETPTRTINEGDPELLKTLR